MNNSNLTLDLEEKLKEQLNFMIEVEIGKKMDEIIINIKEKAKRFDIAQKDKKSPFRNVLAVSVETKSSIEIIKNYIRYQVGRSGSSPIWKDKKNDEIFAKVIVTEVDNLLNTAKEIIQNIKKNIKKESDLQSYLSEKENQIIKDIHLRLAQLYLGYLAREHTALVGESKVKQQNH
jgi:hypothetical protein